MKQEKKKKSSALDLAATLQALDAGNLAYYDALTDAQVKAYAPIVLMRFMSSVENHDAWHAYYLQVMNWHVNRNFWAIAKHKKLQHLLMSMSGIGALPRSTRHAWLAKTTVQQDAALMAFLDTILHGNNRQEHIMYCHVVDVQEFESMVRGCNHDPADTKKILQQFHDLRQSRHARA